MTSPARQRLEEIVEGAMRRVLDERLGPLEERLNTLGQSVETVDVKGAAALLHTTEGAIYARAQRGQMPRRLPGRRLIWRKADLLSIRK